jgi:hypothetical protein
MTVMRDIIDQRFGKLTVIRRVENVGVTKGNPTGRVAFLCKCDCGNELVVRSIALTSGNTKSCGCLKKEYIQSLIGQKFDKMLVIKVVEKVKQSEDDLYGRSMLLCRCDCGKEKLADADKIPSSCGCPLNPEYARQSSAKNVWLRTYNDGNITLEAFMKLSQENCFYCNATPSNKRNVFKNRNWSSQYAIDNGDFIYNGLDRIDQTLPHNLDNVVACCWPCNDKKGKMSQQEFIDWIERTYHNLQKKKNQ